MLAPLSTCKIFERRRARDNIYEPVNAQVTEVAKALVEHDNQVQASLPEQQQKASQDEGNPLWGNDLQHRTKQAFAAAPRFVLLDFR